MTATITQEIPLFPLKTVLFPGGVLPLRVFETRYLDMVSRCMRTDSGFGIIAIHDGEEAGSLPSSIHSVGTLAHIVDFDSLDDGLLGITCLGVQRLQVIDHRLQPDQLLLGQIRLLPDDPASSPQHDHQPLARVLQDLLEREELRSYSRFLTPDWDDAAWIGNRLAELLPLPLAVRQRLLETTEPLQRLDTLLAILHQHTV